MSATELCSAIEVVTAHWLFSQKKITGSCQTAARLIASWNVPWATAVKEDGTFKSADELRSIYAGKGLGPDGEVIAYCRIGERSAHTWFVLKELLGYPEVRNYDGSWTEWGSTIRVPIEK